MAEQAQAGGNRAGVAPANADIRYGGYERFVIELEFVQMLSNPEYLHHLASQKLLDNEEFVAYLDYLRYFRQPKYLRYLQFPGPTLRALELLQEERFRKDILIPDVMMRMVSEGWAAHASDESLPDSSERS